MMKYLNHIIISLAVLALSSASTAVVKVYVLDSKVESQDKAVERIDAKVDKILFLLTKKR